MSSQKGINYNHVLQNLQDYMLNNNNIQRLIETSKTTESNSVEPKSVEPKIFSKPNTPEFFVSKQKDTLFWCFYIMKNGFEKYEELDTTGISIVTEKQLKIGFVEKLRKEKQLLKIYKFASLTHIENQLVNENKIDIKTFLTLCVLENLNIIYLKKKTYYELLMNDSNIIHVVNFNDYGKYGYKLDSENEANKDNIEKYRTTLFNIENIEKPVKALSAYKVNELVEYCSKLGISILNETTNKKKNKNELYESLIQYF
jgi:hypothetical protein